MSYRSKIVDELVVKIKEINGSGTYLSNLYGNVHNKLKFYNEVDDFPSVYLSVGPETREYLPGDFKWAHLSVTIRIYVKAEEPEAELEKVFTDIESVIDANGNLDYDNGKFTEDMKIMAINTDEGLLAPIGVGEITLHIQYDL
jgi:hypothetical protein